MFHFNQKIRHIRTLLCVSLLAFIGAATSAAEPIADDSLKATATASKNTVGVADPFDVTIEAVADQGVYVRFPEIGDRVGDFEITGRRDTLNVPFAEGRKYQRQLTLETLKTGQLKVPEFEIFFKDDQTSDAPMASVKTAAIPITVQTSIANADNPSEFRDIKNVVFLDEPATANSVPWGLLAIIGGLGITGVVGLGAARRFWKNLTPKQQAMRDLGQLLEFGSLTSQDSKFVYEETTRVLRTFIENQLDFPATRQTTEEFLNAVKSDQRLNDPLQRRLKQFLESADMVKFAGLACSSDVLRTAIDSAREFVLQADEQRIAASKQKTDDSFAVPSSIEKSAETGGADTHNSSLLQEETV